MNARPPRGRHLLNGQSSAAILKYVKWVSSRTATRGDVTTKFDNGLWHVCSLGTTGDGRQSLNTPRLTRATRESFERSD
jgi:hypothetical protein